MFTVKFRESFWLRQLDAFYGPLMSQIELGFATASEVQQKLTMFVFEFLMFQHLFLYNLGDSKDT